MFKRLRRHGRWLALAAGILAAPALLGGVTAAPAPDSPAGPPDLGPGELLPPDPVDMESYLALTQLHQTSGMVPPQFQQLVIDAARRHRLDPRLLAAVIQVESEWDAAALGSYGELGLMQILPSTGAFLAKLAHLDKYDLTDPATNLHLGAGYLAGLLQEYGVIAQALAVYNGGPRAAGGWETNLYARKVLKVYRGRQRTNAMPTADLASLDIKTHPYSPTGVRVLRFGRAPVTSPASPATPP